MACGICPVSYEVFLDGQKIDFNDCHGVIGLFRAVGVPFLAADDLVPVARYRTPNLINGIPEGWKLMKHNGTPNMRLVKSEDAYYLNLICDNQSGFGVEKVIRVNLKEYPYLNWTWSAVKLPRGGDVRKASTDDQVLQIYVVLPATGFPSSINTPILTYIWDNEAPKGT